MHPRLSAHQLLDVLATANEIRITSTKMLLSLGLQHAAELQRMASDIAETIDRRSAFVSLFLDPSIEFYESVAHSGQ